MHDGREVIQSRNTLSRYACCDCDCWLCAVTPSAICSPAAVFSASLCSAVCCCVLLALLYRCVCCCVLLSAAVSLLSLLSFSWGRFFKTVSLTLAVAAGGYETIRGGPFPFHLPFTLHLYTSHLSHHSFNIQIPARHQYVSQSIVIYNSQSRSTSTAV